MQNYRIVLELGSELDLTEKQVRRCVELALQDIQPRRWWTFGIKPSSVKAKQFSRVQAAITKAKAKCQTHPTKS